MSVGYDELNLDREIIDEIDKVIAVLLYKRLKLVQHIGEIKTKLHIPVRDGNRESQVLINICKDLDDSQLKLYIERIYKSILTESITLQGEQSSAVPMLDNKAVS